MPNKFGFDELPQRGNIELHCVWCDYRPGRRLSETAMRRHQRGHRKDAEAAAEASKREVATTQTAIVV